jgi:hypothetical protein
MDSAALGLAPLSCGWYVVAALSLAAVSVRGNDRSMAARFAPLSTGYGL